MCDQGAVSRPGHVSACHQGYLVRELRGSAVREVGFCSLVCVPLSGRAYLILDT